LKLGEISLIFLFNFEENHRRKRYGNIKS